MTVHANSVRTQSTNMPPDEVSFRCDGSVALVTGAGSGIGSAIARTLGAAGATVVCADIVAESATQTCAAVRKEGGTALDMYMDVSAEASVDAGVQIAVDRFEHIDILVNNAGIITRSRPLAELSLAEWNQVLGVNLTGAFLCTRAAIRRMLVHRAGVILNVASILGLVAAPPDLYRYANYAASKGGLIAFTRATAAEYAARGIRANAIVPGWIDGTRLGEPDRRAGIDEQAIGDELSGRVISGRLGTPAEVAAAALFLTSNASSYVNGATLEVDGGWLTV